VTPAAAVLCGGQSRRMGTDKAFVEVGGVVMVERVAAALAAAGCAPVVLVGGDVALLERTDRPTVADEWPGAGPGGGVLTALAATSAELVVVASCDLPLLEPGVVRTLVEALAADPALGVAVATTDRPQFSLTAWRRSVASGPLRERWDGGARALHELVDAVPSAAVPVSAGPLRNVNTPDELSAAEADVR
jgi:molybdopterin-guanine dinucleotide biosynthesis protein A